MGKNVNFASELKTCKKLALLDRNNTKGHVMYQDRSLKKMSSLAKRIESLNNEQFGEVEEEDLVQN